MEELDSQPTKRIGPSRRELIKRGAIVGGIAWTAPLILDSVASAQTTQCSPCPCQTDYSGKWEASPQTLCSELTEPPGDSGPGGVDPTCGAPAGGPDEFEQADFSTLEVVACSTTQVTFRLKCNGHFYGICTKGGNDPVVFTPGNECTTQLTVDIPTNLSHVVVYYCCC